MRVLVLALLALSSALGYENNVCPTFHDYYTVKNNSKCWYDLAAELTAPEIIRGLGYPVIEYKVQTVDGFVLTLFRIPNDHATNPNAKRYPIYLQHGLVATCANFIGNGKNSLAFVLSDAGYDVWLGNYRGNNYSEQHLNLTVYDEEYWDHSMDEIVSYDLPAIFHTILKYSHPGSKIIYIGHSLGTTLALMYGAEFPQHKDQIKMMVLLSPAYSLGNMISPYKTPAPYGDTIVDMVRRLEMTRIVSQAGPLRQSVRNFCLESPPLMQFCMQLYNLFYGPGTDLGPEIIPVYFNQLPGGTALKILNHAADLVLGNFRKYNYKGLNFKHYGTLTPPVYDIGRIKVPVYLVFSTGDWATTEADAWNLYRNLPERSRFGIRRINRRNFNHIDFVFGRHARQIVYDDLVKKLNKAISSCVVYLVDRFDYTSSNGNGRRSLVPSAS